jgi:hypothetical protein
MAAAPEVNRRIIEALLQSELPSVPDCRLVLVHGRYDSSSPTEFGLTITGTPRRIQVTDQQSVLGIVDAWQRHREAGPSAEDVLVVTTGIEDAQLG